MKDYMGDSSLAKLASIIKAALKTVSDRVRELEDTAITGVSGDGKNIVTATSGHMTTVSLIDNPSVTSVKAQSLDLNGRGVISGQSGGNPSGTLSIIAITPTKNTGSFPTAGLIRMDSPVSMSGLQINNLAEPTSSQNAATKKYVDDAVSGLEPEGAILATGETEIDQPWLKSGINTGLAISDGSQGDYANVLWLQPNQIVFEDREHTPSPITVREGRLQVGGMPIATQPELHDVELDVQTLSTLANGALQKTGGTMTGQINHGGQRATNLAAPSASTDAATKGYVDKAVSAAESVPPGIVTMFWGSTDTIPDGWVLCDGADGTPDLSDFPGYGNVDGMICYIMRSY